MAKLKWTTEKPTRGGWYWRRIGEDGRPWIVFIGQHGQTWARDLGLFIFDRMGEQLLSELGVTRYNFWAGPIPEPTD